MLSSQYMQSRQTWQSSPCSLVTYAGDCGLCGVLSSQTRQSSQCSLVKYAGDCGLCRVLSSETRQSSQRLLVKHAGDCGLYGMNFSRREMWHVTVA